MTDALAQEAGQTDSPARKARARPRGLTAAAFLAQRLGFYVVTAVFAVVLNFAIPRFMPGNPALVLERQIQAQTGNPPDHQELAGIQALYGDPTKNLPSQFADYVWHVLHLDLGLSISHYPTPVSYLVLHALPWTLTLVGVTTILAWVFGTALGAWTGWRPGGWVDSAITTVSTFLNAVPAFWLALLALAIFSFRLHWAPASGGYDPSVPYSLDNLWFDLSLLAYGAVPAFTLVLVGFSGWQFTMRNVMVTTISEDYVQLARAKGLPEWRVLFQYAARNAMLPNVTGLAHALGGVIGGVVLTEIVFTYPGMGYLLFTAVSDKDFPVMQAIFLLITLAVLVSNFIADSLYVLLDPRTGENT